MVRQGLPIGNQNSLLMILLTNTIAILLMLELDMYTTQHLEIYTANRIIMILDR